MKLSNKNQQFGYIKTPDPVLVVVAKASSIAIGKWKKGAEKRMKKRENSKDEGVEENENEASDLNKSEQTWNRASKLVKSKARQVSISILLASFGYGAACTIPTNLFSQTNLHISAAF
ncbi:hypothetical protein SDJN03_24788, partial [Cucurbita argyrosperma subsp. sororia]